MSSNMYEKVLEFHKTFGHPIGRKPQFLTADRENLRREWQASERDEFKEARERNDIVAAADALADELYFLFGMIVEMGLPMDMIFRAVHEANMNKTWHTMPHAEDCNIGPQSKCTCGKLRYTEVGRVMKPPHWRGPEEVIEYILKHEGN